MFDKVVANEIEHFNKYQIIDFLKYLNNYINIQAEFFQRVYYLFIYYHYYFSLFLFLYFFFFEKKKNKIKKINIYKFINLQF